MPTDRLSPVLQAVSDAVLAVASQRSVEQVLQQLVHSARKLVNARYAALGIPDGAGGFRSFIVSEISDGLIAGMGPLPRTHGMLGAMLEGSRPFRTNAHADPRFPRLVAVSAPGYARSHDYRWHEFGDSHLILWSGAGAPGELVQAAGGDPRAPFKRSFSASVTCLPPIPRKPPSLRALATACATVITNVL